MDNDTITMWTVQTKEVLDVIERDGVSFVKKEFLRKKYQESSWIFETAYDFMVKKAKDIVTKPLEAESMVWMFKDPKWAMSGTGDCKLCLEIPREEIILFDLRKWQKILSLSFIGTSPEESDFDKELERMGIKHSSNVFEKSFYPIQKKKIIQSWERLFDNSALEEEYTQGATWCIKREWIKQGGN